MRWKKSEQSVKFDKFDQNLWDDVLFDMEQVRKGRDKIWEKHDFVNHEYQDIFMQLFQGDPIMEERRDMQEDHIFNHHITQQFETWNEVAELRVSTKYDEYSAAFAMITLQPQIEKLYEENKELMDLMKQIKQLIEKLRETNDPGKAGQIEGQIQELVEQAEGQMGDIPGEFRVAVKKASDDLAEEERLMETFGLGEGQLKRMSFKERRKLAEKLKSGRMVQFANLLGQFKLVAKGVRRSKTSTVPDEVAGLELGADINNLSVESLIELATPETEMKFWEKYFNHELVQRKVVGPHALGKGPIIVVCDESGSMEAACYGGTREMWSKALSLALCDQARKNRRDFYYIGFSGGTSTYMVKFPNGRVDHAKLIEFVEHFYGGGTYPFTALMQAAHIVDSYKQNRPDIVFITDGEFGTPGGYYEDEEADKWYSEWDDIKRRTDMQAFGVAFDCNPREMAKLVDTVINLEDLQSDPSKMADVFKGVDRT